MENMNQISPQKEESTGAQPKLSTVTLVVVSLLSMAMLTGGLALAAHYGDLSMRAGDASMNKPMPNGTLPLNDPPPNNPMNHDMKGTEVPAE